MSAKRQLRVGDLAPDIVGLTMQGKPIHLSQVWGGGPLLLTFLRHFG